MSSLPSQSGVYWFLDEKGRVLYVGKAKKLKNRLRSYTQLKQLSPKIKSMVKKAAKLKWQVLESELEALLIEAELIRLHQPPFNTLLKDDKTPLYLHITDEVFPRVLTLRKKDLSHRHIKGTILGPFQSAHKIKEVLKIVRPIFPWCNSPHNSSPSSKQTQNKKACFYYHLQLCPGVCVGEISPRAYQAQIKNLILFLKGKKKTVLKNLKKQLQDLAAAEKFEQAAVIRDQIKLIQEVTSPRIRLKPTLVLPQLTSERKQILAQLRKILQTYLKLPKQYPLKRIEGYDVSNTSGKLASVSLVTFIQAEPAKKEYRLFNIKTLDSPNDFQMLREALTRRQNHPEWGKPDLVVIDGGKGQVRSVLKSWYWATPVIGIAKHPDRLILPTQISHPDNSTRLKIAWQEVRLPENHPVLHLIQHIRDESHRFSKKQHTRRRLKNLFQ